MAFSIILKVAVLLSIAAVFVDCTCPAIVTRAQWNAKRSRSNAKLSVNPPPYVVIHHSETPECKTTANCKSRIFNIQDYHMNHNGWDDIGYNFLVGGDGKIYEGRGWGRHGAHCPKYNSNSIGICLIGSFQSKSPSSAQLAAVKSLMACGVQLGKIHPHYSLIGHRQGRSTDCPGDALFRIIKTWPHFNGKIHI